MHQLAEKASCVTIRMVESISVFSLWKVSISISEDLESSAPVGSSARISLGPVTSARAQAQRCFCPPDIW